MIFRKHTEEKKYNKSYSDIPGSRNCAAQQRALQIILDLADKSPKRNSVT